MLKTGIIILTIAMIFSGLYAIILIVSPQTIAGSTLVARSGQSLQSIQNPAVSNTIIVQTRHIGIFALTTVIALVFILFTGFKQGAQWAWWSFLIVGIISWGYGLVLQISEGDILNTILHLIGIIIWFVGIIIPVKSFFAKKS
jgi:hypothetical protein